MTFPLAATLVVLLLVLIGLTREALGAEMVMLSGLTALVILGVIDMETALNGFANPSVITIGALYVVGTGLRSTGALETVSVWMFGKPKPGVPLLRFLAPIAGLSAFMNNTPLVAFFLPIWERRLSNDVTAALMGTLAIEAAAQRGISARPLLIAVAIAASCAFATPNGYQTNLMVHNPGWYKFSN